MSAWTPPSPGRTSTRPERPKGDLQKEPPGGVDGVEPADHALGAFAGRVDHEAAPGLRAGPQAAIGPDHRRAAWGQPAVRRRPGTHPGTPLGCWSATDSAGAGAG